MKKLLALLLACVMVLGLVACGGETTEETNAPADNTPATEAVSDEAEGDTAAASGSVYWLNFKPESDEALKQIAAMYTEETGVPVQIVTAASGTYNETLTAEMDKSNPPHDLRRRQHRCCPDLGRLLPGPDRHRCGAGNEHHPVSPV